ncbi:hypothetical protein LXL04_000019 [Taraxacum kok-saghyz]
MYKRLDESEEEMRYVGRIGAPPRHLVVTPSKGYKPKQHPKHPDIIHITNYPTRTVSIHKLRSWFDIWIHRSRYLVPQHAPDQTYLWYSAHLYVPSPSTPPSPSAPCEPRHPCCPVPCTLQSPAVPSEPRRPCDPTPCNPPCPAALYESDRPLTPSLCTLPSPTAPF